MSVVESGVVHRCSVEEIQGSVEEIQAMLDFHLLTGPQRIGARCDAHHLGTPNYGGVRGAQNHGRSAP